VANLRARGDDLEIRIIVDGVLQSAITAISNFNFEIKTEQKDEGFLGEKTNRHDHIYNGCKFDFELQLPTADMFDLAKKIIDTAKRNTPDVQFTISGTFFFANNVTKAIVISDAKFGPIPMSTGGRGDYTKVKIDGAADDFEIQDL
jgi:hypothetical protein